MTEEARMTGDGAIQLIGGVLRTAEWLARPRSVGMRPKVDVAVAQQGQDGVVKRRRRDLDLPALGCRAVLRNHFLQQLELDLAQEALVVFRKAAALRNQAPD